ncbi:hypothetical protein ASC97_30595 [Rhizobium sp. Root1203]|nr:hypothetical protein ASC97_30595 [Rhizobium sp. Root1203]
MTGLRITDRQIARYSVREPSSSRRRIILILIRFRPLGTVPCCQETFKIRKAAGVSSVLEVMEQMSTTAVAILPTLGEERFEV